MREFEEVYSKYAKQVYGYLMTITEDFHLAEELTQETFYRAYKNLKSFKGNSQLSVWLCSIAKNCYFDYLRNKKKYNATELTETIPSDYSISEYFEQKDNLKHIHKSLHNLSEPYKEVFMLRHFSKLSLKDIAENFPKSESWARVTYYRAKNQLKSMLKKQEG